MSGPARRVLVAGVGNVFFGDDGYGVAALGAIDTAGLPPGIDVVDYGIRGVHLAYDVLDGGYDTVIMIDAVPLDDAPGSLRAIEVRPEDVAEPDAVPGCLGAGLPDAHGMDPVAVLRLLGQLGGAVRRVVVVGCQPASLAAGMALSEPVAAATKAGAELASRLAIEAAEDRAGPTTGGVRRA